MNSLITLNVTFLALLHARLIIYGTGDKQGWRKTDDLTQYFGLLQYGKPITKRLVFWWSPIKFALNTKKHQTEASDLSVQTKV